MNKLLTIALALMLTACATPKNEAYCASFRLAKESAEYANCKAYFAKMDGWFAGDRNGCTEKAASVIPEYMYDHVRYGEAQNIDRYGIVRSTSILIEPDYTRNQSLDAEREKIITPCMLQKGWKSSVTWQAGRTGQSNAPAF